MRQGLGLEWPIARAGVGRGSTSSFHLKRRTHRDSIAFQGKRQHPTKEGIREFLKIRIARTLLMEFPKLSYERMWEFLKMGIEKLSR
jgi:hypothetical protein